MLTQPLWNILSNLLLCNSNKASNQSSFWRLCVILLDNMSQLQLHCVSNITEPHDLCACNKNNGNSALWHGIAIFIVMQSLVWFSKSLPATLMICKVYWTRKKCNIKTAVTAQISCGDPPESYQVYFYHSLCASYGCSSIQPHGMLKRLCAEWMLLIV